MGILLAYLNLPWEGWYVKVNNQLSNKLVIHLRRGIPLGGISAPCNGIYIGYFFLISCIAFDALQGAFLPSCFSHLSLCIQPRRNTKVKLRSTGSAKAETHQQHTSPVFCSDLLLSRQRLPLLPLSGPNPE